MRITDRLIPFTLAMAVMLVGCTSHPVNPKAAKSTTQPQNSSSVGQVVTQLTPPAPAPSPARHKSPKLVEDSMTAGARGPQPVTFVIKDADATVENAHVSILTANGRPAGSGNSNDWGEFKTSLSPGRYTAIIQYQGETTTLHVRIDTTTQEVPLNLTLPSPNP